MSFQVLCEPCDTTERSATTVVMADISDPSAKPSPSAAKNDSTSSVFVTKDPFFLAAKECNLSDEQATKLWEKLASGASQRIIGGATAPRQDASNVNNWHWAEQDLAPWAKERLTALIVGLAAKNVPDKGWVKVTELEKCEGEASVSNRKGKRIVAYELKVTCKWKGSVDYDEVSGELILPYVSEDVEDSAYEIKLIAKKGEEGDDSHKKAIRYLTKELPTLKEALKVFTKEIYAK